MCNRPRLEERLIEATHAALETDGELLDDEERAEILTLVTALAALANGDSVEKIEEATKALATGTDEFAARRMNKSIRRALAGRKLDDV